jgi:hypothetical protein
MGNDQPDHGHFSDGQATLPHDAGDEQGGDFSEGQEKMHPDKGHAGSFAHGQEGEHTEHDTPGTFAEGRRPG